MSSPAEQSVVSMYPFGYEGSSGITLSGINKFPNPWFDSASEYVPRDITSILEWCTPAGTLIDIDAHGNTRVIEEFKPGDKVLTLDGTIDTVDKVSTRSVDEELVRIKVSGISGMDLRITKEHPVYCWRPIGDLDPHELDFSTMAREGTYRPAGEVGVGDWVCYSAIKPVVDVRDFPYSPFIVGMYISEGCLLKAYLADGKQHVGGVQFTLGAHEQKLIDKLIRELSEYCGKAPSVITHHTRPDIINIRMHDPFLSDWLKSNCGEYSYGKRVPEALFHMSKDAILEFFGAWIDGDGYATKDKDGNIRSAHIYSCSQSLLYQGMRLAHMCGMVPSFSTRTRLPTTGFNKEASQECRLTFNKCDLEQLAVYTDRLSAYIFDGDTFRSNGVELCNGFIWRKVKEVTTEQFKGNVYNIRVAEKHNYVANGITVHNCEYIMLSNGTYRAAARRVVRYFLTELVLEGEDEKEKDKYEKFLNDELHLMQRLADIGDDFMCFHKDTPVPTRNGIYPIHELVGKTVDVLSQGGVYRPAEFKAFGVQELMEVEFSDGRTVLATPEHEWVVPKSNGGTIRVPTTKLGGRRIERTVAPRPEKNEEYREGVRHGFVFGDGSIYNKTRKTPMGVANFFGAEDMAVMPFFEGQGHTPKTYQDGKLRKVHGLPAHYKQLPTNDASASYWYGFLCGFLAADGSVDVYGCPLLTQVSRATLEAIVAQLPRIGMAAGPIREYDSCCEFDRPDGTHYKHEGKYCIVSLLKRFMCVEDLIIESHITKFIENASDTEYGKYIRVKSVKSTGLVDTVYCCVEPKTHTFVIGNGILTGNCYGNVFLSVYFPFDRWLICPKCYTGYHVDTLDYQFMAKDGTFRGRCIKCEETVTFKREDRRSPDTTKVKLIRWNPKMIKMRVHPISGTIEYYLELEQNFVEKLRQGDRFFLNQTPWSMVEACVIHRQKGEPVLFKFRHDVLYHMKDSTLSGIPVKGWAIPPIMPNFKLAWYIQMLRRYDEAICMDFIMPFRVISPSASGSPAGQDPLSTMSMGNFIGHMKNMIDNKRKYMTDIQISPFPLDYQMLGGEGKELTPKDNIAQALDELLNAMGFPAELYKGSLSIQAFPVALRLFEKTWGNLVGGYNDFISWLLKRISRHFMWGEVTGELRSVTLADDIERKALMFQAAAGQDISKGTAYRPLNIDYVEEQKRVIKEQETIQKLQQEAMERSQAMSGQGQAGQAQGAQGDPNAMQPGATPGDVNEQGKQLAQQLLFQTPPSMRRGELIKIKQSNPTLHAIVMQEMNNIRSSMASQGQAAMMQQAQQQGAGQKAASADLNMDEFRKMPSPFMIGVLISDQLLEYNRRDLQKIACDIKQGIPGVREAFHFIFERLEGMIQ